MGCSSSIPVSDAAPNPIAAKEATSALSSEVNTANSSPSTSTTKVAEAAVLTPETASVESPTIDNDTNDRPVPRSPGHTGHESFSVYLQDEKGAPLGKGGGTDDEDDEPEFFDEGTAESTIEEVLAGDPTDEQHQSPSKKEPAEQAPPLTIGDESHAVKVLPVVETGDTTGAVANEGKSKGKKKNKGDSHQEQHQPKQDSNDEVEVKKKKKRASISTSSPSEAKPDVDHAATHKESATSQEKVPSLFSPTSSSPSKNRPKIEFTKLDRPPLPTFEEPPDWLFKPQDQERHGLFGIAAGVHKDHEGKDVPGVGISVDSSRTKSLKAASSENDVKDSQDPESRLLRALNHDPRDKYNQYLDEDVLVLIAEHPKLCSRRYKFDCFEAKAYPLSMLVTLFPSGASMDVIKRCYNAYPEAVSETDAGLGTPLHYACAYQAPMNVMQLLLKKAAAGTEQVNRYKRTPLHVACMSQPMPEVVELLLEEDPISIKSLDADGKTALHLACEHGADVEVVEKLVHDYTRACVVTSSAGATPLHLAVASKASLHVLKVLVKAHIKPLSTSDNNGRLPLHLAVAIKSDVKVLKLLVKHYPEGLTMKNKVGETPRELAERMQLSKQVLELLQPDDE